MKVWTSFLAASCVVLQEVDAVKRPLAAILSKDAYGTTKSMPQVRQSSPQSAVEQLRRVPRGGGGPFSADLASKIFIYVYGAKSVQGLLMPELYAKKLFMMKEITETVKFMVLTVTGSGANTSLLLFLQTFKGMPFEKALGWSVLPFTAQLVGKHLVNYHAKVGISKELANREIVPLAINLAVLVGSQLEADWALPIFKLYGIFSLINAVPWCIDGAKEAKRWGITLSTPSEIGLGSVFGTYLASHGAAVTAQAFGASLGLATGLAAIALAVTLSVACFGRGQATKMGTPPFMQWAWVALLIACGSSLM
jgi:hypothetical protein